MSDQDRVVLIAIRIRGPVKPGDIDGMIASAEEFDMKQLPRDMVDGTLADYLSVITGTPPRVTIARPQKSHKVIPASAGVLPQGRGKQKRSVILTDYKPRSGSIGRTVEKQSAHIREIDPRLKPEIVRYSAGAIGVRINIVESLRAIGKTIDEIIDTPQSERAPADRAIAAAYRNQRAGTPQLKGLGRAKE